MAKKVLKKHANGGPTKSEKLAKRAEKVMGRAQKDYGKVKFAMEEDERKPDKTSITDAYVSRLTNRMLRREEKAKELKRRSEAVKKKGGSVSKKK